ncbi:MAG: hypothetical protein WAP58_05645, partial [Peptococcia bacterium]
MSNASEKQRSYKNVEVAGHFVKVEAGSLILNLLPEPCEDKPQRQVPIVGARYNNQIVDLYTELNEDGKVEFLDLTCEDGLRIYRQSLVFLLSRAFFELFPQARVSIKHSLNKNFYCEVEGREKLSPLDLQALEAKMREIIEADEPILPQVLSQQTALDMLEAFGYDDKVALLSSLQPQEIKLYSVGSYSDYSYSVLAPSTGLLGVFKLQPYADGFLIRFPTTDNPLELAPYRQLPKLGQIFR